MHSSNMTKWCVHKQKFNKFEIIIVYSLSYIVIHQIKYAEPKVS